ncbi:MAG: hypothetical protein KAS95_00040 [Candidatus Heimdallarchaeota archaeon]|nr:hypothetical protein [Candidatus Heimdallarchaeota archaeon]
METWNKLYSGTIESFLLREKKLQQVVMGFNVNIDKIIRIGPDTLQDLKSKNLDDFLLQKEVPKDINSIESFILCLLSAIEGGKADEKLIVAEDVCDWIENTFVVDEIKIGGQAGIMANLLTKLELADVLLSLPVYDDSFVDLLHDKINIPFESNGICSVQPITKLHGFENKRFIHYIFEFDKGIYYLPTYDSIECPRQNRFIASHDTVNSLLEIKNCFKKYSLENIQRYSIAIVSGFHLLNPEMRDNTTHYDIIAPIISMFKEWKKLNPDLKIHLEFAATRDKKLIEVIFQRLLPLVNSIGLNEQELLSVLETTNVTTYKKLRNEMSSVNLFEGILNIWVKYPHLRIHLHYLGYYLTISSRLHEKDAIKRKQALILSAVFAAVKARNSSICSTVEISKVPCSVSKSGYDEIRGLISFLKSEYKSIGEIEEGIVSTDSFTVVGIPTIMIKSAQQLVGVGDTISVLALLLEN